MAYAAVISLKQTIHRLLNSSHISVVSSSRETLDSAFTQLVSLQEVLKKSDGSNCNRKRLNPLEGRIARDLHELEDSLEFLASDQIISSSGEELDFKEVRLKICSFIEAAKDVEKHYNQELDNPNYSDNEDLAEAVPTLIGMDSGSAAVEMVGLSDQFNDLKFYMSGVIRPEDFSFFSFFGEEGTGRSVVAKSVYDDVESSFDCRAWVKIGSTFQLKEILVNIISQIDNPDDLLDLPEEEEKLGEYLHASLEGKRYILGWDDIHGTDILIQLRRFLPEHNNGSVVFLTTCLMEVAEFDDSFVLAKLPKAAGDDEFNWNFIMSTCFESREATPAEFSEAGKKIASNCRGLSLVLARMILFLRRNKRIIELWKWLAVDEDHVLYRVEDEISETIEVERDLGDGDQVWSKGLLDLSNLTERTKEHLYPERFLPKMLIVTIFGMAGVGKTTLMKKLFQDPSVSQRFDHCVWINVGSKYKSENILVDVLAQVYPNIDMGNIKEDAELPTELSSQLSKKKLLIVLDDLWSQEPVHYLKKLIPNIKGVLMVTTRLFKVALFGPCDKGKKIRLLNKEESWNLFGERVFEERMYSGRVVRAAKKIADNCEGLPLFLLAVADQLSKSEITLEFFNEVAENRNHKVMVDAQMEISPMLLPSYERLPQHLKACFLYMGVFPLSCEISLSKLQNMWFVEGFLEPDPSQTAEDCASKYLYELLGENVVMVRQMGSYSKSYKSCSLHFVFWHLSCNEARKDEFFQVLTASIDDGSKKSETRGRILCIRNSILLGFNKVQDEIRSHSTLRALLCTGQPHQYPVPLYFGSRLLRVLDAPEVRLYEFPVEVVELLHLRYLALTCHGTLPPSISRLWNLEFLIVKQGLIIKSSINSSCLPEEIWGMKQLKHLQISSKLPDPNHGDLLPNLSSLLDVSGQSCTERVLRSVPNLKKLGIQIELTPNDNSTNDFHCLKNIYCLGKLESLKCVVVNPDLGSEDVAPPPRFPSSLKKLSLSGIGYPWEYMSAIGELPNLEVLKLRCYAFQGPFWEMDYGTFNKLRFLSIEDADLVRWDLKSSLTLQIIFMKHCFELEQLPYHLPPTLVKLEVVDGHPSAETWAKEMKEKNWEILRMETLEIEVKSSWNEENLN